MSWSDRFLERGSALCVGLDPEPERIPAGVPVEDFCRGVVEATEDLAGCYKANAGFFERLGPEGVAIFARLLAWIRGRGIPVIADAKRGDVANTAQAYADAFFGGPFDCDALTVNPSLGLDSVEPFREAARARGRGVLLLLRTSNPGAAPFQEAVEAHLVEAIRAEPAFGAVVGATAPETGARLRAALPETLFLVPGFGAQGGDDLAPFFTETGAGAVVNSSRGVLYPGGGPDWRQAVRDAAATARETIERARKR